MRVHLGGHLNWYDPHKRAWLEMYFSAPVTLIELVRQLGVPPEEIAVSVVNGDTVSLENGRAADGDRVEFFPPVGGGSAA
jgi:sulfur carrier protein ThiS